MISHEWARQVDRALAEYSVRLEAHSTLLAQWGDRLSVLERLLANVDARLEAAEARLAALEGVEHLCTLPDAGPSHTHTIGHRIVLRGRG